MTTSPNVHFEDLMVYRSKRSRGGGLYVTVDDLPAYGVTTQQSEEYWFIFRPRAERGTHRLADHLAAVDGGRETIDAVYELIEDDTLAGH